MHINTHTHPSRPPPEPQAGGWVGFPNYLSRFQQMVGELSSRGHLALPPNFSSPSQQTWLLFNSFLLNPPQKQTFTFLSFFKIWAQKLQSLPSFLHTRTSAPSLGEDGGADHALRLSNTFSGTRRGVLQGETELLCMCSSRSQETLN